MALAFLDPGCAEAQVAGDVTLASNEIYRGHSLSSDDPALTLAAAAEFKGGFFAGGSVSVAAGDRDTRVSSAVAYAGHAVRNGEFSAEFGAVFRHNPELAGTEYNRDYVEAYVGGTWRTTSLRLYVSPDYVPGGRLSAYASLDAKLASLGRFSLGGHAGLAIVPHHGPGGTSYHTDADWALRVSRAIGSFRLSAGIADSTDNGPAARGGPFLFAAVSRAF